MANRINFLYLSFIICAVLSFLYRFSSTSCQVYSPPHPTASQQHSHRIRTLNYPLLSHLPLQLPLFKYICHLPYSVFIHLLQDVNSFLTIDATTPHEFIITGDFNIHLTISPLSFCLFYLLSTPLTMSAFLPVTKTTFSIWSKPLLTPHLLRLFPNTFLFSLNSLLQHFILSGGSTPSTSDLF